MTTRIKSGLRISDQEMVFDPSTGESFTLNPTGLAILKLMVEGADEDRIFEIMSKDYQITEAEFERYFVDFISVLKSCQLLENDA
ncbi:MAG: PqqD family protein [Porphyromonadaceae bacterium]|nr:MAG: PqqD family protein [Porphyromonadaceae bacterium]